MISREEGLEQQFGMDMMQDSQLVLSQLKSNFLSKFFFFFFFFSFSFTSICCLSHLQLKMVDVVSPRGMPSENEVHVARSFLTKILRSSMRYKLHLVIEA